jgi:hypothetical protein
MTVYQRRRRRRRRSEMLFLVFNKIVCGLSKEENINIQERVRDG